MYLKQRGIFKESFTLEDQEKIELLVMKPQMKWTQINYEYLITTTDNFDTFANKELLLMTSLHCANYYILLMVA